MDGGRDGSAIACLFAAPIDIALDTDNPLRSKLPIVSSLATRNRPLHVRAIRRRETGGARENSGDAGAVPVAPAVTDIAADVETGPTPRRRNRRRTRQIDGCAADKDREGRNEKLLHGRLPRIRKLPRWAATRRLAKFEAGTCNPKATSWK